MQIQRFLSQIIKDIASLPVEGQIIALRNGPPQLREFMRFVFTKADLDVPLKGLDVIPISARAMNSVEVYQPGDDDLLMAECGSALRFNRLVKLFVKGVHPTLTSKRRAELLRQLLERLPPDEIKMMQVVVRQRSLPYPFDIARETVEAAWPGMLDEPLILVQMPQGYSQLPSATSGDVIGIGELDQASEQRRVVTEQERARYREAMSKMNW